MTAPTLELLPQHDRAIREHGRRAYPHECCGFLLGEADKAVRRVHTVMPAVNARGEEELHHRFTISPEAFMRADKAARNVRLEILGFYHSHPDVAARPSEYDLQHAWPVYSYVIVSVVKGEAREMTSWVLEDDRSKFNPQPLNVADASGV